MADRAFSVGPTLEGDDLVADKLNTRDEELLGFINDGFGQDNTAFPDSKAGSNNKLLQSTSNTTGATAWTYGIRSTNVDLLYDGATVGSANQIFVSDGDGTVSLVSSAIPTAWANKTSNFNFASGDQCSVDTTAGAVTGTLPASPSYGNFVVVTPGISTNWGTNNFIFGRNSQLIDGVAANKTLSTNAYTLALFIGGATGWKTMQLENVPISVMTGATPSVAGASGLVPQPAAGEDDEVLFGDATFKRITPVHIDYTTSIKTSNYTAAAGDVILANTSGGSFTLTLKASPTAGDRIYVTDYSGTFNTFPLTIGRNSSPINGLAEDMTAGIQWASYTLAYVDGTQGWKVLQGWV